MSEETYAGENTINELQRKFEEAVARGDHELATKINAQLEQASEAACKLADLRLRLTLGHFK